jgi:DNA-binding transcriptional LysR family regulator
VPIKGALRSNSLSVLLEAAEQGMGVAALPCYIAEGALRAGTVVAVLEDWSLPAQEIHAVYPSPRMVPFKVSGLVAWLQEQFVDGWWTRTPAAVADTDNRA